MQARIASIDSIERASHAGARWPEEYGFEGCSGKFAAAQHRFQIARIRFADQTVRGQQ